MRVKPPESAGDNKTEERFAGKHNMDDRQTSLIEATDNTSGDKRSPKAVSIPAKKFLELWKAWVSTDPVKSMDEFVLLIEVETKLWYAKHAPNDSQVIAGNIPCPKLESIRQRMYLYNSEMEDAGYQPWAVPVNPPLRKRKSAKEERLDLFAEMCVEGDKVRNARQVDQLSTYTQTGEVGSDLNQGSD
jgi:hypothetical protein